MCAIPLIAAGVEQRPDHAAGRSVRHEQRLADRRAELGHRDRRPRGPRRSNAIAPRQRVAVGVQAGRRQADEHVARRDASCRRSSASRVDDADDEAGDVVFAVGVEARHLRGLAAEQRAAVLAARRRQTLDDLHGDVGLEPAGGEVVEEEQRLGALDEDVVDAVIDEVARRSCRGRRS